MNPVRGAIAALIFDLDGTLVDSEAPGLEVLHEMAVAPGISFKSCRKRSAMLARKSLTNCT